MANQLHGYFRQDKKFKLDIGSLFIFFILCIVTWLLNIFTQITFPSKSFIPYFARTACLTIGVLIMIVGTNRLLKSNNIPKEVLGLKLSLKSFFSFILGAGIGIITVIVIGGLLYFFVPYHFEVGSVKGIEVIKEANSYFWGNFLEELIFRGYPLIIVSQLFGWPKAVWIMALPFGLFHLQGLGFSMEGLKMVITTATFSFIFSYTFILIRTLWAAIGSHVMANVMLHSVSGLDGLESAMFKPVFETKWPVNYDPGLISFLLGAIIISVLLYIFIKLRFRSLPPT